MNISEKNVIAGVIISIKDNQLLFNEDAAASWTDDFTADCAVELSFTPASGAVSRAIASGDVLSEAGTLKLTVSDEFSNSSSAEIVLTAVAVTGLENLQNKQLQVNTPVNLLEGLTFAEGLTLQKVEIEQNGIRTEIADPSAYTPDQTGTFNIILILAKPDGSAIEIRIDNLIVK